MPSLPANLQQERAGILAVAGEVNRLGLIWRETPLVDVGIDGQIEFVDDMGRVTGQLLAVQVKCGGSYFHDHGDEWWYYPDEKHRFYWERYPLPVLVMLHSPEENATYWADARHALRSPMTSDEKHISIPKVNRLQFTTREGLFSATGASGTPLLAIPLVLALLVRRESGEAGLPLTYFDLFVHGLVNIGRSLFYGMSLVMEVAEIKDRLAGGEFGIGLGHQEHEFLWGYICYLVEQHLADINMSDAMIDWYDRQIHPMFIAPLTSRGRELVALIHRLQERFEAAGDLSAPEYIGVAQEGLLQLVLQGGHLQRFPVIQRFHQLVREKTPVEVRPAGGLL
jgi:hypothetical protein